MQAKLSVVATPIGNLEDITHRALRVLRECDAILCEDTRVTKKLLARYDIHTPLISYHAHSSHTKYDAILSLLQEGKWLALVSDAGTPAVSDPGAHLVATVRRELGEEVHIEAIPGPSAVLSALSVAGSNADTFTFFGFPPHKKGRKTFFENVSVSQHTAVVFESPHRILKTLTALEASLAPTRTVTVCRELTKMHEQVVAGSANEVATWFNEHPERVRGEFVVVISI
jgi:16S rRNA (cytidine1402-2'-O)-methyltransferase